MPSNPDDGKYEEVAVLGYDGVWHHVSQYGQTMCRAGRQNHYDTVDVTCMLCIAMVADGHRPSVWLL